MYLTWNDVSFRLRTARVTAKPDLGFFPKRWEEREVPVPSELAQLLENHPHTLGSAFLFPSPTGNREQHLLDRCKAIADRAGLDSSKFNVKTFRSTYATRMLRAGFDVRTVQHWMGHKSLELPCATWFPRKTCTIVLIRFIFREFLLGRRNSPEANPHPAVSGKRRSCGVPGGAILWDQFCPAPSSRLLSSEHGRAQGQLLPSAESGTVRGRARGGSDVAWQQRKSSTSEARPSNDQVRRKGPTWPRISPSSLIKAIAIQKLATASRSTGYTVSGNDLQLRLMKKQKSDSSLLPTDENRSDSVGSR